MVVLEMRGAIDHPSVTVVSFHQYDAIRAWGSTLDALDPIAGQGAAVGRRRVDADAHAEHRYDMLPPTRNGVVLVREAIADLGGARDGLLGCDGVSSAVFVICMVLASRCGVPSSTRATRGAKPSATKARETSSTAERAGMSDED